MVVFFTSSVVDPPATIYVGKDKEENEDLIKYGFPEDVWFHVDKLSSAHVYIRLQPVGESNKRDNVNVIYTPWSNLNKTGDMAIGQVGFHREDKVKRVYVKTKENAIINRLNRTRVVREVDHEAEKMDRAKKEAAEARKRAVEVKRKATELARAREAEKKARSYDGLFSEEVEPAQQTVEEMEEDFM